MEKNRANLSADEKFAERRKFIKKAGKTAITAPAVALLLSIESKRAKAITPISGTADAFPV